MLSNAGDVMLMSSSHKDKGILVIYSTLPTENLLKIKYTVKHGFNSYDKGLNQEMVTTAAAVTALCK